MINPAIVIFALVITAVITVLVLVSCYYFCKTRKTTELDLEIGDFIKEKDDFVASVPDDSVPEDYDSEIDLKPESQEAKPGKPASSPEIPELIPSKLSSDSKAWISPESDLTPASTPTSYLEVHIAVSSELSVPATTLISRPQPILDDKESVTTPETKSGPLTPIPARYDDNSAEYFAANITPNLLIPGYAKPAINERKRDVVIVVDASRTAFGGYCVIKDLQRVEYYCVPHEEQRLWFKVKNMNDSSELEMKNVIFSFYMFLKYLRGCSLTLYTDSSTIRGETNVYANHVRNFLIWLRDEESVRIKNSRTHFINRHYNPSKFEMYIRPADSLSRLDVNDAFDRLYEQYPEMIVQRVFPHYDS